jgi:hypothetical protein
MWKETCIIFTRDRLKKEVCTQKLVYRFMKDNSIKVPGMWKFMEDNVTCGDVWKL